MRTFYYKDDLGKSFGFVLAFALLGQILLSVILGSFDTHWSFWLMQGLYTLLIGGSAFIYASIAKVNVVAATKINKKPPVTHIGWGCLAAAFLIMASLVVDSWFTQLIVKLGFPEPGVDISNHMQIVPLIIVACIMPAFTEEIVFRGTVAQSLERERNKLAALAISGALFALFHMNPAQTIHQFVLGAFLALLVFRSGSLWTASAVHLFNNLAAVVLSFVSIDESVFEKFQWLFFVVGVVGFAACIFGYIKTTKSEWLPAATNEDGTPVNYPNGRMDRTSKIALIISVIVCSALWLAMLVVRV